MPDRIPNKVWKSMSKQQQQAALDKRASKDKKKSVPKQGPKKKGQSVKVASMGTKNGDRRNRSQQVIASNLAPNQDSRIQISATFSADSYVRAFYALVGYLAQKNVINVNTVEQPQQYGAIYDSLQYLCQQGITNFLGTTTAVNEMPLVFDNWFQSLLPKQFHYDAGFISYGFKAFDTTNISLVQAQSIYGHTFGLTRVIADAGIGNEIALAYVLGSTPDSYTQFLSIVNKLDPKGNLATVDWKSSPTLKNNVSSYARTYSYVGNQSTPQLSGVWLDEELELGLDAPMLGKIVPYQDNQGATDPRIPRYLMPSSLDSLCILGWPLHSSFAGYYNKTPAMVNQIDADQIFVTMCLWMAKLKGKALDLGMTAAALPLPFSQQSLYLALRSALLCVFDSQYFMQFQGSNQWTTANQNAFLGFFTMAHCCGNSFFGRLNVPIILAENIAALKARSVGKPGSKNPQVYLPVVGRWFRDTLPLINIVDSSGTVVGPLFAPDDAYTIDPIDCTSGGNFINVQGTFYEGVVMDWNDEVEKWKEYSAPVQEIASDGGPPGLLCATTNRLITKMLGASVEKSAAVPARTCQSLQYLENKPFDIVKIGGRNSLVPKPSPKEGVGVIPDASILTLITNTIVSKFPISQEAQELFDIIILPTSRPSENNDVLLKSMLQVMGKESYSYAQSVTGITVASTGAGEWSRCNQYANELVTGLARGETTKFQQIFAKLISNGHAGMLASLLGGIAKGIFPGNDSIIDTISNIVPI